MRKIDILKRIACYWLSSLTILSSGGNFLAQSRTLEKPPAKKTKQSHTISVAKAVVPVIGISAVIGGLTYALWPRNEANENPPPGRSQNPPPSGNTSAHHKSDIPAYAKSVSQLAVKLNHDRTFANTECNTPLKRFFQGNYAPTYAIQNEEISVNNPMDTSGKRIYSFCNIVFDSRGIFNGNYLNDVKNSNACILNPGNLQRPGGSVLVEKGSLEEALFRETLLADSLFQAFVDGIYYIPNLKCRQCIDNPYNRNVVCRHVADLTRDKECFQRGVYSSNVPVSTETNICHDYVTVATPKLPDDKSSIESDFWNEYDEIMLNMIRMVIVSAINHGRTTLILCALGCGWFKNPPEKVAEAFRKVLIDENLIQYFGKIIFPILVVKNHGSYTYQQFYNAFAKVKNVIISQAGDAIIK